MTLIAIVVVGICCSLFRGRGPLFKTLIISDDFEIDDSMSIFMKDEATV
jgi:hypothetical protein